MILLPIDISWHTICLPHQMNDTKQVTGYDQRHPGTGFAPSSFTTDRASSLFGWNDETASPTPTTYINLMEWTKLVFAIPGDVNLLFRRCC